MTHRLIKYRLVNVSAYDLKEMNDKMVKMMIHVIGCYLRVEMHRSAKEAPFGANEVPPRNT